MEDGLIQEGIPSLEADRRAIVILLSLITFDMQQVRHARIGESHSLFANQEFFRTELEEDEKQKAESKSSQSDTPCEDGMHNISRCLEFANQCGVCATVAACCTFCYQSQPFHLKKPTTGCNLRLMDFGRGAMVWSTPNV